MVSNLHLGLSLLLTNMYSVWLVISSCFPRLPRLIILSVFILDLPSTQCYLLSVFLQLMVSNCFLLSSATLSKSSFSFPHEFAINPASSISYMMLRFFFLLMILLTIIFQSFCCTYSCLTALSFFFVHPLNSFPFEALLFPAEVKIV